MQYAPNFKAAVFGRQINSPLDLERTFGLIGGDIFHGALSLDQMFSARPMLGYGNYRGPLPRLVYVRIRHTSRRRRHWRTRAQRRTARFFSIFAGVDCVAPGEKKRKQHDTFFRS